MNYYRIRKIILRLLQMKNSSDLAKAISKRHMKQISREYVKAMREVKYGSLRPKSSVGSKLPQNKGN